MSPYTPAGISACDIDVARRNLRKTPPNSPPRPPPSARRRNRAGNTARPRARSRGALRRPRRLRHVATSARIGAAARACRDGALHDTALPCAATALAAALSTSPRHRAATIATAAYATAPEQSWKALAAVLAAVLALLEAPRSFIW